MEDVIEQSEGLTLSDATNKKGMGVRTAKYSYLANSSGQDNLGQILLSILSFQNLKQQMGAAYRGGILLIDEVDATLHPAAQNKLFDYMYKKAKLLNLQIVFTTHSLSLISHIQRKHELNEKNKSLSLLYLKNSRNTIEIEENPSEMSVEYDLLNQYGHPRLESKIKVLTEDGTARWFLKKILDFFETTYSLYFHECSISFENIAKLISGDPDYFKDYITVLDPDTVEGDKPRRINMLLNNSPFRFNEPITELQYKILCLPGEKRIETLMWEYTESLPSDHLFYQNERNRTLGITRRSFVEPRRESYLNLCSDKEKHKAWFHDNMNHMETVAT